MSDSSSPLPVPPAAGPDQPTAPVPPSATQPTLPYPPSPQGLPPAPRAEAAATPSQAYPGAAPSFTPPPAPPASELAPSQQQPYGTAQQPYGTAQQPYGAAHQPYGSTAQQPYGTAQQQYGARTQQAGYPIYGGQYTPVSRPTSGLALTSLICGIAGVVLFWLFLPMLASIVAVITGHMALRQIKADPSLGGRGMAIAGVIMGYVMVAFLVLSIAVTVFSFLFVGAFTLPFIFSS
ncbi:DUF4190 domain-containing protein [Microbacterium sp. C5A9]|uniref:DUF4190 domain-containing protein n=1 Tax=Microbacterium sp. C5A9 TaxID=2736663 RepID=UPI001F51C48B|nr:DUF4190 domain-containing protein [Microbacterium sp. C5A9]MCI1020498.1 DUF4190 domain-containing protein [Microbacterium sp. C5A9]